MKSIFIIFVISLAVSYGWGMRGALIGGEKGAALPGALLGMFLALFSGNQYIAERFYYFAAMGAIGMAYGGFEPYAQTMGFILHRDGADFNRKKGYLGLILKGILWFGIAGEIVGMSFGALSGKYYSVAQIVALFLLIPIIQVIGVHIFNKPYDTHKKVYPKIYFSLTSREEWGGNLLMLIIFLAVSIYNGDFYAVGFSLVGIVSGAIGWCIGIFFYDIQVHPMKNGKYIFGKAHPYIDGWKIMEYTLGAVSGLGFGIFYEATKGTMLKERLDVISENGFWNPYPNHQGAIAWVIFALSIFTVLQYAKKAEKHFRIFEIFERAILFAIPAVPILLGNGIMAQLLAFSSILFVAAEQVVFDRAEKDPRKKIFGIIFGIIVAISVVLQIMFELPPVAYILMYWIYYIIADNATRKKNQFKYSVLTVNGYFLIQGLILTLVTVFVL